MTSIITEGILSNLRQRRMAGESVKALAAEVGVTWQKLDKAIRNGLWHNADRKTIPAAGFGQKATQAAPTPAKKPGPLTERYRPRTLDEIAGQPRVVDFLKRFATYPHANAFIFEGETGTGKTTAAMALAAAIGCDLTQKPMEFGGVWTIASGEQTADSVREMYRRMWSTPFHGSGWKVVIVNEADRMSPQAETIWLDILESLPARTVVVFTTNYAAKLPARFRDRCIRNAFASDAEKVRESAVAFAAGVWKAETGRAADMSRIRGIVADSEQEGQISFRRVLQVLAVALGKEVTL